MADIKNDRSGNLSDVGQRRYLELNRKFREWRLPDRIRLEEDLLPRQSKGNG